MNNDIAIRVENLGKMYHIGREVTRAANMCEAVQLAAMAPFRYTKDMIRHHQYMKQLIHDSDNQSPITTNHEQITNNNEPNP